MRREARAGVDAGQEEPIRCDVVDQPGLPGLDDVPHDPLSGLKGAPGDPALLGAERLVKHQLAGLLLHQRERTGLHPQDLPDALHRRCQDLVQIQAQGDGAADLVEGSQLPVPLAQGLLRAPHPHDDLDARQQLARIEGLGQIVVRPHLEPERLVGDGGQRSGHQDRGRGKRGVLLHALDHLVPVDAGHHDVEQQDVDGAAVRPRATKHLQRVLAGARVQDLTAAELQHLANEADHVRIVVGDQNLGYVLLPLALHCISRLAMPSPPHPCPSGGGAERNQRSRAVTQADGAYPTARSGPP